MQSHTDIDTNGLRHFRRRIIHNQPSSGELPRQASDNQRYKQIRRSLNTQGATKIMPSITAQNTARQNYQDLSLNRLTA